MGRFCVICETKRQITRIIPIKVHGNYTPVLLAPSGCRKYQEQGKMEEYIETRPVVRKANDLISAKYKTSLLGNKIIAISLTKIQKERDGNLLSATLYPTELRHVLGMDDDANLYKKLKTVSRTLAGNIITIENNEKKGETVKKSFQTFALVTNVEYKDQKLKIVFNSEMKNFITNLTSNYTQMELATLISFNKAPSFRLYELLKSKSWQRKYARSSIVSVRYNLNELRAELGLINTDAAYINDAFARYKSWDYVVEHVVKKEDIQFPRYSDFKSRVLVPAQEELAESSDLSFEFEEERGAHGRVESLVFLISRNKPDDASQRNIEQHSKRLAEVAPKYRSMADGKEEFDAEAKYGHDLLNAYAKMRQYLKKSGIKNLKPFTIEYFDALMQNAGQDVKRIQNQVDYGATQEKIRNYYGWLRKAVEGDYAGTNIVEAENGSTDDADLVRELHEEINKDPFKEKIWERFKQKEDFPKFLDTLGVTVDVFEIAYSVDERLDLYTKFVRNEKLG